MQFGTEPATSLSAAAWMESPILTTVVRYVAWTYGLSETENPDVLQEVRIALWLGGLDRMLTAAWVFGTAAHKALDFRRRRDRCAQNGPDNTAAPQGSADCELFHLLKARVGSLPLRLRAFYELRYEQGLTEREIATRLGVCRASVRWLDSVCQRKLKGL